MTSLVPGGLRQAAAGRDGGSSAPWRHARVSRRSRRRGLGASRERWSPGRGARV